MSEAAVCSLFYTHIAICACITLPIYFWFRYSIMMHLTERTVSLTKLLRSFGTSYDVITFHTKDMLCHRKYLKNLIIVTVVNKILHSVCTDTLHFWLKKYIATMLVLQLHLFLNMYFLSVSASRLLKWGLGKAPIFRPP